MGFRDLVVRMDSQMKKKMGDFGNLNPQTSDP